MNRTVVLAPVGGFLLLLVALAGVLLWMDFLARATACSL
jgi:hypothetical protein